jgi:stringent starvation protein B
MSELSTKPYLLRAIYEWCTDSGYTPHMAVKVDGATQVPMAFVKNGEIVLNISFGATSGLKMDNECVRFSARFGGVSRDIYVPVENVMAIYANENGQGMAFEVTLPINRSGATGADKTASAPEPASAAPALASVPSSKKTEPACDADGTVHDDDPEPPKKGGKPTLTRIK